MYVLDTVSCVRIWRALGALFLMQGFGGVLLALMFSVNHNGMEVVSRSDSTKTNFYHLAVNTGRNVVPSRMVTWFTGGLNYQIEHHMFPSLPRHNFHKVTGRVATLCAKHNIPYQRTTLVFDLREVFDRLSRVAAAAAAQARCESVAIT